jgi:hypothetical protein
MALAEPPPPEGSHQHDLRDLSQGMSIAALAMLLVFVLAMLASILPGKLLDPAWQLGMVAASVDNAVIPLVALLVLHGAAWMNPGDFFSRGLRDGASRWAVAAALGFLLLVPLQGVAGLQQSRSTTSAQSSRISGAERRLVALRQAVASATSNEEINQRLQRLQGPVLGPADIAQPLPLLKAQVDAVLDQAALQIARERQAAPPTNHWRLLPELLRNGIACLALALGFAALAMRPGSPRTLLQEWQKGWSGLLKSLRQRRAPQWLRFLLR